MIECLYIHIPFCLKKCPYCDFLSIPYDESLALPYVSALIRELALRREQCGRLRTIYIGGGTPTVIPASSLIRLLRSIMRTFTLSPNAEVTIEANPGTVTFASMQALIDAGINRVSLGVQSFADSDLKLLCRVHDRSGALKAIAVARRAGVENLSIDLMYGLPGQTPESWERHLGKAIDISPEHLSAYELTPEKGTPFEAALSNGEMTLPTEESVLEMYDLAIDTLTAAGYHHYEISNFARPGFECRHNVNYWERGEYLGIGAGAHSFAGGRRWRNINLIRKYMQSLADGIIPTDEETNLSSDDTVKENLFLGLRMTNGIVLERFSEESGIDLLRFVRELVNDGYLAVSGGRVYLTRKGIVVSNTIIARLFVLLGL